MYTAKNRFKDRKKTSILESINPGKRSAAKGLLTWSQFSQEHVSRFNKSFHVVPRCCICCICWAGTFKGTGLGSRRLRRTGATSSKCHPCANSRACPPALARWFGGRCAGRERPRSSPRPPPACRASCRPRPVSPGEAPASPRSRPEGRGRRWRRNRFPFRARQAAAPLCSSLRCGRRTLRGLDLDAPGRRSAPRRCKGCKPAAE